MAGGALPLNWGMAELLAYGTLLEEGYPIRITGQDVRRGTFSHRHAVVFNQKDGEAYLPMAICRKISRALISMTRFCLKKRCWPLNTAMRLQLPKVLIIWEAQFGDFANGAQVVIDQFIASGEHKWARLSGLTMLLPHGFEGQGPEHSSARLERFLQLCAEHNMQVVIPTTPAQIFHLLRRQAIRPMRRPLIIMSPKWICVTSWRHPLWKSLPVVSSRMLSLTASSIRLKHRVILCSGKVYYHLLEEREARGIDDIALVRIEQLYPFPDIELEEALKPYVNMKDAVWCQEEPINQGAWYSSQHHMRTYFSV